jgi:hypothetical protein
MYKITNNALSKELAQFDVLDIYALTTEQLESICIDKGVEVLYRLNNKKERLGIDKIRTAENLESRFSVSEYMGELHWEERHRLLNTEAGILDQIAGHTDGDQTFETYSRYKLGVFKLRPGQSADVDWTPRWIKEVFEHKPFKEFCTLEELGAAPIVLEPGKEAIEVSKLVSLDDLDYDALLKEARKRGIVNRRVVKDELVKKIQYAIQHPEAPNEEPNEEPNEPNTNELDEQIDTPVDVAV